MSSSNSKQGGRDRRKKHVSDNTKSADKTIIKQFREFVVKPFTDDLLGFSLQPITSREPIIEFIKMTFTVIGLFLIGFIRILRPVRAGRPEGENIKYQDILIRYSSL